MLQLFVMSRFIYPIQIYRGGHEINKFGTWNWPRTLWVILSSVRWDLSRYSCTKFEVSSFTNYKFTKGVLKFNNSASGPWPRPLCRYFVTYEMGLSKIYLGTKSSFTRSKDTAPVQRNGWMREGCAQTNAWIYVTFHLTLTKFGVSIEECPLLNT